MSWINKLRNKKLIDAFREWKQAETKYSFEKWLDAKNKLEDIQNDKYPSSPWLGYESFDRQAAYRIEQFTLGTTESGSYMFCIEKRGGLHSPIRLKLAFSKEQTEGYNCNIYKDYEGNYYVIEDE